MLMVRLQRKQTSTGDVRQREEQGEGSVLEEGDGAGAAGREGSPSGFHCTARGSGGSQGGSGGQGENCSSSIPTLKRPPSLVTVSYRGPSVTRAKNVVQHVRRIWKRDFT